MSINQWAVNNNAGFAIPMQSATPVAPDTQAFTLAWDPLTQLLAWVPVSIGALTGDVAPLGHVNLAAAKTLRVGALQVVSARNVGWVPPTGTANKATFDTATVTLAQLAGAVLSLNAALTTHGLIGA